MLNRTILARAMLLAFSGVAMSGMSLAQTATPATPTTPTTAPEQLQRVEVTGSRIKRIEGEGAQPVQVITKEEITRSGAANVNDALQRISGAGGTLDDRFTNGFAPGGGGLNLRNLGFNSTLVLVNGRRLPTYPFAQQVGTSQGFNDLQNIPIAALERIEILKDGASAIYGADAVGGVVNIILRQDYRGLEVGGSIGQSSHADGRTRDGSLTFGTGSLESDRYNVLVGLNVFKGDEIPSSARGFARTEDLRSRGGADRRSSYGFPGTFAGDTIEPGPGCGPITQTSGSSVNSSGFCKYDRAALGSLISGNERDGLYTKGTFAITPQVQLFGELMFTRNKYSSNGWPAGTTDDVGLGSNFLPPGSPQNPQPDGYTQVLYRFADVGNRGNDGTSDTSRFVGGVKGDVAGWDFESGVNLNKIKINNTATNNALNSHTLCLTNPDAAAGYVAGGDPLGNGTLAQIFAANPAYATYFQNQLAGCPAAFAKYGYYNYQNPSQNVAGTADYLRHDSSRVGDSRLYSIDGKISRELYTLPGGALAFSLGAETRYEKVSDIPDIELQTGDTLAISAAQAFGSRHVSAAYTELVAPITKELEIDGALRYDKYTGNGSFSKASPKVGLRYQPIKSVLFRATASGAFRAPSLFETSPAQQTSFSFGIQDPVKCPTFDENNPACVEDVRRVQSGNPNLKAETSHAYTVGIVFEPTDSVTLSLDGYRINRHNEISSFADQLLVNLYANDPSIVVRNSNGQITQINQVPVQLNGTQTYGVDAEIGVRSNFGEYGRLTSKIGATYVGSFKFSTVDDNGNPTVSQFNGTFEQPRWRSTFDFDWVRGPVDVFVNGYSVGAYQGVGLTTKVGSFTITNVGAGYSFNSNFSLRFQVNNALNRQPPFLDETNGGSAGYDPEFAEVIGRFYKLSATYKFF